MRAVLPGGAAITAHAESVLEKLYQIRLDNALLDRAARIVFVGLRSLDAIHLEAALAIGSQLESIVTYDQRMSDAATKFGLTVNSPGSDKPI